MGTITISDTVTMSLDNFTVQDTHSISGGLSTSASDDTHSSTWTDNGTDSAGMSTSGTNSTSACDALTFIDTESSTDKFMLNKTKPN